MSLLAFGDDDANELLPMGNNSDVFDDDLEVGLMPQDEMREIDEDDDLEEGLALSGITVEKEARGGWGGGWGGDSAALVGGLRRYKNNPGAEAVVGLCERHFGVQEVDVIFEKEKEGSDERKSYFRVVRKDGINVGTLSINTKGKFYGDLVWINRSGWKKKKMEHSRWVHFALTKMYQGVDILSYYEYSEDREDGPLSQMQFMLLMIVAVIVPVFGIGAGLYFIFTQKGNMRTQGKNLLCTGLVEAVLLLLLIVVVQNWG
jgi:hypothetical protein